MSSLYDDRPKRRGAAEIASVLRRSILSGDLALRERLAPERTLAAEFSVARGTVREALNQLATEELVQIRPGSGTYVVYETTNLPNPVMLNANPTTLLDARSVIEPQVCDKLIALVGTYPKNDTAEQADADAEFHDLIGEASGNEVLAWMVNQLHGARHQEAWARMRQVSSAEDYAVQHMQQHRAIVDAIHRRDTAQARQSMLDHLEAERALLASDRAPARV